MKKMYAGELIITPEDSRRHDVASYFQFLQPKWEKAQQKDNFIQLRIKKFGLNPFRFFSKEDVKNSITQDEWNKYSNDIMFQYRNLGFPSYDELMEDVENGDLEFVNDYDELSGTRQVFSGSRIWVEQYSRSDGTTVKGHFRARPIHN